MRPLQLCALLLLSGCVSIPAETVALSQQLTVEIEGTRKSHLALVDEYGAQRRARANDFMRYVWTPRFIRHLLEAIDFQKTICKLAGKMDRAHEVQELVEAITKQTEAERSKLFSAIRKIERKLKAGLRDHYAQLDGMNRTVTANLQTVSERLDMEKAVRGLVTKPLNKVIPIDKASEKLDALFRAPGE